MIDENPLFSYDIYQNLKRKGVILYMEDSDSDTNRTHISM